MVKKKCGCEFIFNQTKGVSPVTVTKYIAVCSVHKNTRPNGAVARLGVRSTVIKITKKEAREWLDLKIMELGFDTLGELESYAHKSTDFKEASKIDLYIQVGYSDN